MTEPLTDAILHRIPAVEKAEIRQMINGPESFTPDGHAILGEAPGVSELIIIIVIVDLKAVRSMILFV